MKPQDYTDFHEKITDDASMNLYLGYTNTEKVFLLEDILAHPGEDRLGHEGSRVAIGQTRDGRHLRVIYVPDKNPNSIFVITAYDLLGKPLIAYRRRMHRRKK